jgi:hypothetical protein
MKMKNHYLITLLLNEIMKLSQFIAPYNPHKKPVHEIGGSSKNGVWQHRLV